MLKTHKATTKRFRLTKGGKVLKKKAGQNHFNSREKSTTTRMKRRPVKMGEEFWKTIKLLTPFS